MKALTHSLAFLFCLPNISRTTNLKNTENICLHRLFLHSYDTEKTFTSFKDKLILVIIFK